MEIRAQVGGTLTQIGFRDGQIVRAGAPLFTIDPRPFAIRLAQAQAQLQTAEARRTLADVSSGAPSSSADRASAPRENVDQRSADQRAADAAIDAARAAVADAQLDLEFARVTAPFTGRIGAHLVSVGSLVSGGRGGAGPSTLLATVVSLDPIHLDFDMSEADYLAFQAAHRGGAPDERVRLSLGGDGPLDRAGHARLHRQRREPRQRHHPRPRHGAQPRPGPHPRAVRARLRADRASPRRRCSSRPPPSCRTSRASSS